MTFYLRRLKMSELGNLASIECDIMSTRSKDGFPIHQPIVMGNSIVCDGYVSGKTNGAYLPRRQKIVGRHQRQRHCDSDWNPAPQCPLIQASP